MTFHSKRSRFCPLMLTWEKKSEWTNMAVTTSTTTAAAQRPGWRTGPTGNSVGRPGTVAGGAVFPYPLSAPGRDSRRPLAAGFIEPGIGDAPLADAPLVEDRLVPAAGDDGFDRSQQWLRQAAVPGHYEA